MNLKPIFTNHSNEFISRINKLTSDVDKIKEFEKAKACDKPFVIVDKTKSQAYVYNKDIITDTFEVGVGKTYGDDLNTVKYDFKQGLFLDGGETTPPGMFVTQRPYNIYSSDEYSSVKGQINILVLKGVQHPADYKQNTSIALHQVSNKMQKRLEQFKTIDTRRSMSNGFINFRPQDFEKLKGRINESGTTVYILPEEKGNSLELVQLPNGLWFKPHYQDKNKENVFISALKKFFKL